MTSPQFLHSDLQKLYHVVFSNDFNVSILDNMLEPVAGGLLHSDDHVLRIEVSNRRFPPFRWFQAKDVRAQISKMRSECIPVLL